MNFSKKTVLVVDDDFEVVELVKAILRTKGHEVLVAYNGEEGWAQLLEKKPNLVITDLRMPKMSGLELCRKIRNTPEVMETPILVISSLTAGTDKSDEFWAMGLKSDDFLPKPFDPLTLLGRVEYLLRKNEYISSPRGPEGGNRAEPRSPAGGPAPTADVEKPGEVVTAFIECWNRKDFACEYKSLGEEMLGGVSIEDYVQRRAQLYADEHGENVEQKVLDSDVKITHNVATVAVLREDMINGVPKRKDERYTLKRTQDGWKIIGVRSRPLTFVVE